MLVSAGGDSADSPRGAAEGADAVVLIPFDGAQLESALFADVGVLGGLERGSLVLAMATVGPRLMQTLARQVRDRGRYHFVDAPVTGRQPEGDDFGGMGTLKEFKEEDLGWIVKEDNDEPAW